MAAHNEVVRLLIENRANLFAFIFSAVRDHHAAEEIMQNVAVVVCDKADQYQAGTSFRAWTREIARRQLLQYLRQSNRGPCVVSPTDLEYLVAAFDEIEQENVMEDRVQALRECLGNTSKKIRSMFRFRYEERMSLEQMAERMQLKSDSVRKALYRSRVALRKCIDRQLEVPRQGHG